MSNSPTNSLDPTALVAQNPSGVKGFFAKLGQGLHDAAPQLEEIGARLAQAGGNPGPMQMLEQKQRLQQQQNQFQQQFDERQAMDKLQRDQLAQNIALNDPNSPQFKAKQQATLDQQRQLLQLQRSLSAPTQFTALNPQDNSYGLYQRSLSPEGEYKVSPVTVPGAPVPNPTQAQTPQQLPAGNQGPMPSAPPLTSSAIGDVLKPSSTVTPQVQLQSAPKLAFSPAGIDTDPNSPTYGQSIQYVRNPLAGVNVGTVAAPAGRGVMDMFAPTVTNNERPVTQPTGEITKENFSSTRRRVLQGNGAGAAPTSGGGGTPNSAPGNFGTGPVVGGKAPTPVTKAFQDVQDASQRLQTMQNDLKEIAANPNGNIGSADMDLLSQHIALTFGTVKNARGGEQLIQAHIKARSLPEDLQVAYSQLAHGGQLSPQQRQNFVNLAQQRLKAYQDRYAAAQAAARGGFGMNGEPPVNPGAPPSSVPSFSDWQRQRNGSPH